jgi:DNA-binding PadR family transcriptional regulator
MIPPVPATSYILYQNIVAESISTTEGAVLGLLAAAGERSGYDLAKLAGRGLVYVWTPSQSQIYKVLPHLAAAGLATAREIEQRGRPDKALYQITTEGLDVLRAWLDEVEDEPLGGRVVFVLKLFFSEFASPATAPAHLAAYHRFLTRRLEEYQRIEAHSDEPSTGYPMHVLRHGLIRVRATLAWIEETAAAIESEVRLSV